MKKIFTLGFMVFWFFAAVAQNSEIDEANNLPIFNVVEIKPEFKGGQAGFVKFLQENMKYPEQDIKDEREGKVYLQFIIEKDGSVTEVKPIGKVEEWATEAMVAEAMRLLNIMPKFEPGMQNG
ncbi:MAG: energy transducer TonB, partial [Bacteroidia bacterium]